MNAELDTLSDWCQANNLLINCSKTKEMIFSNLRDNPQPPALKINNYKLERVESYRYLGTVLTNKLSFASNTSAVVDKARRRLYIMSRLARLGVNEMLRRAAYKSFIESVLTFHLTTIYQHLTSTDVKAINHTAKTASYLGRLELPTLHETYMKALKNRVLTIYTDPNPVIEFDRLPSGRFRSLKRRINLRKNCFRFVAIDLLNSIFS